MLRAHVPPFFTQDHRDVADMTQTQAGAIRPKRFAAFPAMRSGNPRALVILVRHMGHEVFDRFLFHGLPADLSYRFWIKANNFQGLFESLPHHVATTKLSYIEIYP